MKYEEDITVVVELTTREAALVSFALGGLAFLKPGIVPEALGILRKLSDDSEYPSTTDGIKPSA